MNKNDLINIRNRDMIKNTNRESRLLLTVRLIVVVYIISLTFWGVTTFSLETEIRLLSSVWGISPDVPPETYSGMKAWIATVREGVVQTNSDYPFLAYGTDWLAFAHLLIAVAFVGVYRKPVRNKWIIYFGMISCAGVIPLALICGEIRHIPFYWRLIDCSFGIVGFIPLYILHRLVKKMEKWAIMEYNVP
jgi:hypothetical protein